MKKRTPRLFKKFLLFGLFLMIMSLQNSYAQQTISGVVTDQMGLPLPGANILEKGTSNGVTTDFDGNFSLTLSKQNAILVFTYVGYATKEISTNGQTKFKISLQESAASLDEIVIVGYGQQKEVNLTGSVSTVKASAIGRQPVAQASQALAGLVPGLTATQSSGQPGGDGATIRIRGIGTLGNGAKNNPLILVDGIPDDINGVDPNDIQSISVLKDASAAAIYGSRAANGVILITTNRGKVGELKTTYNGYIGVQSIAQNLNFMNAADYMTAFNSAEPGAFDQSVIDAYRSGVGVGKENMPDTDWVDLLFSEPGFQQYHNLSVRGGSENAKISASISIMDQDGNIPNFNFKRYNGRFNTDLKISDKLDINFDLNFKRENQHAPSELQNVTRSAYRLQPLFVAINDNGTWGAGFNGGNPVALVNSISSDRTINNYFRGVIKATYKPIENMSVAVTYAPQFVDRDREDFNGGWLWQENSNTPPRTDLLINNQLLKETFTSFNDNFNVVLNYNKEIGDHNFSGLLGYEFLKFNSEEMTAQRKFFVLPEFHGLDNGDADTQLNSGSSTLNGLESIFGRLNYAYKDRYLFEANVRRDASSRFAKGSRAATFPSLSLGWKISEEDFFPKDITVSSLKLRTSWGQLGNQFIFDDNGNAVNFAYTSLFGVGNASPTIGGTPIVGGAQTILSNPILKWETGVTSNIAIDAGLFKERLSFTGEYYVRTTKDILLGVTIPTSVGFIPPVQNAGEVQNKGLDISMGWKDSVNEFSYGVNFNYSYFINEITDLGGLTELPPGNTINRVGESIGSIYGLKVDGLYQESDFTNGALNSNLPVPTFGAIKPGDIKYTDINDDMIINNSDRDIIGSNLANKNWGFDVFAEYKGFDISVSLLGTGGRDVVLEGDAGYAFFNAGKIQEWQGDYWSPQNTTAQYPRLTPGSAHPNWRTSETWMFNTSYIRLRNVTLGYKLPAKIIEKLKISNFRLFVSGQNLVTIDHMPDGIDPLVPSFSDGGFYPVTRVFTTGVSITF